MGRKKSKRGRQMILSKSLEQRIDSFDDFEVTLAREVYKGKEIKQDELEVEVSDLIFGDSLPKNNLSNDDVITNKIVAWILAIGFVCVVAVIGYIILMLGR